MDLENSSSKWRRRGLREVLAERLMKLHEGAWKMENAWNELVNLAEKIPRERGKVSMDSFTFLMGDSGK